MTLSDSDPVILPAAAPQATFGRWRNHLLASPRFQNWAARFPLTRRLVRQDGIAMFDLVAGFCHSQILAALVELDVLGQLRDGPLPGDGLAKRCQIPPERMRVLLRAAVALDLLRVSRGDRYALSRKGAALTGVPGLSAMIRHHHVLYRDLADPVAFFRGDGPGGLAAFWPYVFGAAQAEDPQVAARYSDLMAESQALVAADTLHVARLSGVRHLMDVGGGTGAFLTAVAACYPDMKLTLFDLPAVVPGATDRFAAAGLSQRVRIAPGSFRDDPLPQEADAISLVRVLYDHADTTVAALLSAVFAALPPGGQLIVSEPMTGGAQPERAGDAYFALYTMAMGTGRTRSAAEIADLCRAAGFGQITHHRPLRPFVTRVLTARKN